MEDATRSFGNNLRMLYPEYYDDEVSNGSEGNIKYILCVHWPRLLFAK